VIRPLRRVHRAAVLLLALLLPALIILAVSSRAPVPVQHPWVIEAAR
jgi:hypothetical protein